MAFSDIPSYVVTSLGYGWDLDTLDWIKSTMSANASQVAITNIPHVIVDSSPASSGLTNTELRASAVPISLATAPSTPVTGTFWQATQPVSSTTLATAASQEAVTSNSGTLGALNDAVTITLAVGHAGVGVTVLAGTLDATIRFEQSGDAGTTWSNITTVAHATLAQAATATLTNPNPTSYYTILVSDAATMIRVRISAYTSGSAVAYVNASQVISPFALSLSAGVPGQVVPLITTHIGGTDGGTSRALTIRSASSLPATTDTAAVVTLRETLDPAQGAASASQTGPMVQGIVSDVGPNFIPDAIQALSLTTDGLLRVTTLEARIPDYADIAPEFSSTSDSNQWEVVEVPFGL